MAAITSVRPPLSEAMPAFYDNGEINDLLAELNLEEEEGKKLEVPETQVETVQIVTPEKFAHFHCPRTLPTPNYWPNKPLLVRNSAITSGLESTSENQPINIGVPFPIETPLFSGMGMFRLRSTEGCQEYFKGAHLTDRHKGREMRSSFIVTGQFKKSLPFDKVLTGQEFCHPIKVPGLFVGKAILNGFKLLAPLLRVSVDQKSTNYMLSPLCQTVQAMNISKTPLVLEKNTFIVEDTTLLGGDLASKPLSWAARKKLFSRVKELEKYSFDPALYYTFDFYDNKLETEQFLLHIIGQRYDLAPYLVGQPLRLLGRVDGDIEGAKHSYLWNVEIWHEKQTKS